MKQINVTMLAIILAITTGFAQKTKTEFSKSARAVKVIVFSLTGNSSIQASANDEVKIKSFLQSKGDVWGWKSPDKRPEFKISDRISGDTLFVTTPQVYSPNTIGINTYSENIDNTIMVPEGKKVYVKHSEKLTLEDEMEYVDVNNTNELNVSIPKSGVRLLKCNAADDLKINSKENSKSYELNGLGTHTYSLAARQITLNLK